MPDFFIALNAAITSLKDEGLAEIELIWQEQYDDRAITLTVIARSETEDLVAEVDE